MAESELSELLSYEAIKGSRYDEWLNLAPAERLAELARGWWSLENVPSPDTGAWTPFVDGAGRDLRFELLSLVGRHRGEAVADEGALVDLFLWHRPFVAGAPTAVTGALALATWSEARCLGLVGANSLSEAGLALLDEHTGVAPPLPVPDRLATAYAAVGSVVGRTHLQADLSAVVVGTPAPTLAALLDSIADRETRGTASVWRFSPDTVRRALDRGQHADELLEGLAEVAATGIPQTLEYLVRDVQRRHGAVRMSEAVCFLRGDDIALLAEIAADRKLRSLELRPRPNRPHQREATSGDARRATQGRLRTGPGGPRRSHRVRQRRTETGIGEANIRAARTRGATRPRRGGVACGRRRGG